MSQRTSIFFELIVALLLFIVFVFLLYFPYATNPSKYLLKGDPYLNTWILNYVTSNVLSNPIAMFEAPIFHPNRMTLAYSENLIGMVPFFWLAKLLTNDIIASYNSLWLLSFALRGLCMFALCRIGLRLPVLASFFAGVIFGFTHIFMSSSYQIQMQWAWLWPLCVLFLLLLFRTNQWRFAILLSVTFVLQAYGSIHIMMFTIVTFIGIGVFFFDRKAIAPFIKALVAGAASLPAIALLLSPYLYVRNALGFRRTLNEAMYFAQDVINVLTPSNFASGFTKSFLPGFYGNIKVPMLIGLAVLPAIVIGVFALVRSRDDMDRSRRFQKIIKYLIIGYTVIIVLTAAIAVLFPNHADIALGINREVKSYVVLPLLISIYLWLISREKPWEHRLLSALAMLAVLGVFLAFGPQVKFAGEAIGPGLHGYAFQLPLFSSIRSTARWGTLAVFGGAVLAAFGIAFLQKLLGNTQMKIIAIAAIAVSLFEFYPGTMPVLPLVEYDKPVYHWLAEQPGEFSILEMPLKPYSHVHRRYLLAQAIHGKRLVHGYSGFLPSSARMLRTIAKTFPDPASISAIRGYDYKYLLVHTDMLGSKKSSAWRFAMAGLGNHFHLVREFGSTLVYEVDKGIDRLPGRLFYPPNAQSISFDYAPFGSGDLLPRAIRLKINGNLLENELNSLDQHQQFDDISKFTSPDVPTEIFIDHRYLPTEEVRFRQGIKAPLHITVETGGNKDFSRSTNINNVYYDLNSGYNLFFMTSEGVVKEHLVARTGWDKSANDRITDFVQSIEGKEGFLLIASGNRPAGKLSDETIETFRSLGLRFDIRKNLNLDHIALVQFPQKKSAWEKTVNKFKKMQIGKFDNTIGMSIENIDVSYSPKESSNH